jgi:4-hydroxy-tetrahydrodipicolinate synthase
MNTNFKGTGVALVTPFHQDGTIDFTSFGKLIDFVSDGGVNFLVVMGTTAESPCLNSDEKAAILSFAIQHNNKNLPIIYGMGGNNTSLLVDQIINQDFNGIDGILSVAPYYNKPTQEGLYQHFNRIAQVSPVPIILYNVPGRTGSNLQPETVIRLAKKHKNIVALKAASGNMEAVMQIINNKPKDFYILSGDDALTLPLIASGAEGVISVVANAFPNDFSSMVKLAMDNKYNQARIIHYQLLEKIAMMFEQGNPAGVKAFLSNMKLVKNYMRLPITPVDEDLMNRITQTFKN